MQKSNKKRNIIFFAAAVIMATVELIFFNAAIVFGVAFRFFFYSFCCVGCLFAIGVVLKVNRDYRLETEVYFLNQQNKASEKHTKILALSQEKIQEQLEQIKNQLLLIQNDIEDDQPDKAAEILEELIGSLQSRKIIRHYSNNQIVDVILSIKELEAKNQNIKTTFQVVFPDEISIPAPSLISLLFNLLDNGIEACAASQSQEPFLNLFVDYKGDFLLLSMENSKNPAQPFQNQTTKEDPFLHGMGLSIIEELAASRDGSCEWNDLGDRFQSKVLLHY